MLSGCSLTATDPAARGDHPGFTAVSSPTTGTYCLTTAAGVPSRENDAVASVAHDLSQGADNLVQVVSEPSSCNEGQLELMTFSADGNDLSTVGFNVAVP